MNFSQKGKTNLRLWIDIEIVFGLFYAGTELSI